MRWTDLRCQRVQSDNKIMARYTSSAQKLHGGNVVLSDSVNPLAGEMLDDGFDRTTKPPVVPSLAALPIPANWTTPQWNDFIADEQEAGKSNGVIYLELVRIIQNGTPGT